MNQAAADRIGINATDLNCLNILSFKGQMTAGELARETGLTTASITGVVDRLEEAGYVRRERDPRDRRRVVIRLVLETALRDVASVFLPMMRDWQQMAARYSDDELGLIVGFLRPDGRDPARAPGPAPRGRPGPRLSRDPRAPSWPGKHLARTGLMSRSPVSSLGPPQT